MTIDQFQINGKILMLALDHRGSLERILPDKEKIIEVKKMLLQSLASAYSGVLLDAQYGLNAYQESQVHKPYLLCIEKTGYTDTDHERLTQLEYSVAELKAKGAQGVKLLVFFHPEAKTAIAQIALAKRVLDECKAANLPFFLEILNYSLSDQPYTASLLVPKSVEMFLAAGVTADVFKLEFPGSADACDQVTTLLGNTPWILLTKGASYDEFVAGLRVAIAHGAKGFLAGRSLWQDFVSLSQEKWPEFFQTTVKARFDEIARIALQLPL